MGYLICDTCQGYYELKKGESPEDFSSKCECGGNLEFKSSINHPGTESTGRDKIAHGYSHTDKQSYKYRNIMILGGLLVLVGIIGLLMFNILGLIIAVAGGLIYSYGYNEGRSWMKGDEGEKLVSLYLEDLPGGYFVFNDVKIPGGKGNFDHIVIGPGGIFLIETKNYSGFYKIDGDNWYLSRGNNKRLLKRNPSRQAKVNALDLANFLKKELGTKYWVNAVVTLVKNNFSVVERPNNYYVIGAKDLTKFILKFQTKFDKKTANSIVNLMQDYSTEIYFKKEDVEIE